MFNYSYLISSFFPIKTKSNSFENFLKLNFAGFFWLVCLLAFIYYHRYKFLASMSISQDFCKMSTLF